MNIFYDILVICGVFTSFITSILLFTRGGYQVHANRLLGIVIFTWGWYAFLYLLVSTGWIKSIPEIYRIGSPLYYLIPPCSYLYVRSILLDQTRLKKYDWLHFIPAFLNFIDLLPYYFSDIETKRAVATAIADNFNLSYQRGSGIIPAFWHFQLRWFSGIVYLILQWGLLCRLTKRGQFKYFKKVTNWLITFTSFNTIIYVGLAAMSVFAWINLGKEKNILFSGRSIPTFLQVVGFMCMSVYLFFKPDVLYGIPQTSALSQGNEDKEEDPKIQSGVTEKTFDPQLIDQYVDRIKQYIHREKPFKKQGFTVNELAHGLGIQLHHLSYVLNNHFRQRFTDFINSYRINYVLEKLEDAQWRSFTLEALAKEAGFSSRSTFFSAFKKVTGVSPSSYIQSKKETQI